MRNTIFMNATIVDGSGDSRYLGNVMVENGTIVKIQRCEESTAGNMWPTDDVSTVSAVSDRSIVKIAKIIDATGLILAPGFIDTHSHSDLAILEEPYLEPKIRQGITTEILGQDGISMAPLPKAYQQNWRSNISGLNGSSEALAWDYETVEGYMHLLETAPQRSNSAYLIPHGNVRMEVMGLSDNEPSKDQIAMMKQRVRQYMKEGCIGLSTGLIYIPCTYAKEQELIELCKIVREFDGVFVVHQRSEANKILESMDEILRIGIASGVKIHFSHFKICGKKNWKLMPKVLKKLDEAKAMGINVSFDMYPYTAGSTMLSAILPPWVHVGGTHDMLHRLRDLGIRKMIHDEVRSHHTNWDNFISFAGVNGIYITSVGSKKNEDLIGKSLHEIGKLKGLHPIDAAFNLLIEEKNEVGMIDYYGYEAHIKQLIQRDEMNACTDGLLGGKPHPRVYGAFPKIIAEYVVKDPVLSLEAAIHKFTGKPAEVFSLKGRGLIKEGCIADLVLFDQDTFQDHATYLQPRQFPTGLKAVYVGGEPVYLDNDTTSAFPGKLIRHRCD